MGFSRKLLDSGKYNINEVGEKVGYSTASATLRLLKRNMGLPKKVRSFSNRIR